MRSCIGENSGSRPKKLYHPTWFVERYQADKIQGFEVYSAESIFEKCEIFAGYDPQWSSWCLDMLIEKKVSQLIQIFQKPQIQNDSEIHLYLLKFPGRA